MLADMISKLTQWKATSGDFDSNRYWAITSYDAGVKVTLTWKFGGTQLGGADRFVSNAQIAAAAFPVVEAAVDHVLKQFSEWQAAYAASRPGKTEGATPEVLTAAERDEVAGALGYTPGDDHVRFVTHLFSAWSPAQLEDELGRLGAIVLTDSQRRGMARKLEDLRIALAVRRARSTPTENPDASHNDVRERDQPPAGAAGATG